MQRGGPGLGNISASQSDYFQAVKGGGHGDYRLLVYAPYNLQELWDLTMLAFDNADRYRTPVMILGDAILGQMMEPFVPTPYVQPDLPEKTWALSGCGNGKANIIRSGDVSVAGQNVIKSLFMGEGELEQRNYMLQTKYQTMKDKEVRFHTYSTDDANLIVVAFGIAARIATSAVRRLRNEGHQIGLFRPITLFPFPEKALHELAGGNRKFIVVELNSGQMVEDVRLAVNGKSEVLFYGRPGGAIITPEELHERLLTVCSKH
jgi:2-oxoglutarate ferredoxin oxidoreductase subunit alpha